MSENRKCLLANCFQKNLTPSTLCGNFYERPPLIAGGWGIVFGHRHFGATRINSSAKS